MPIYTYSQLKSDVNGKIKGKIGVLIDVRSTLNQAAREVFSQIDLVSSRRKMALIPNLFSREFQYAAPTDLKGYALINIQPQTLRRQRSYDLVASEQFFSNPLPNTVAVDDHDFMRTLLINSNQSNCLSVCVAPLDTPTSGGGQWLAVGGATNIRADSDNFVRQNGSLEFDINGNMNTTAGIQNTALNQFDASAFFGGNGALFVWAWITSLDNLTNYVMNIGSDNGNYYQKIVTSQNDGSAFAVGWNLLRFDLNNFNATIGTPVLTSFKYIALYMTKGLTKINQTNYRFDSIMLKKGEPNNVEYYSKYPWQTSGGVWIENSLNDSDLLNVTMDEYNLVLLKATEFAAEEVDEEIETIKVYRGQQFFNPRYEKFKQLQKLYEVNHPSESMTMIVTVAKFIRL